MRVSAIVAFLALLSSGCATHDDPVSLHGFNETGLEALDRDIDERIARRDIPGALTIIARDGVEAHRYVAGYRDVENAIPLTYDTIFRWRSMTKPLVAVSAMILVEEGRLHLDDPVSRYVPCFASMRVYVGGSGENAVTVPARSEITVRQLLSHTSGLIIQPNADTELHRIWRALPYGMVPRDFPSLQAAAEEACNAPLMFHPGEGWEYGINNDILGYVIEVAAGMPLQDFMRERLFEPLGMTDTGFYVPDNKLSRFTVQYESGPDGLRRLQSIEESPWRNPNRAPSGNAGLVGTPGDYLRFLLMLANDGELDGVRILSKRSIDQMAVDHVPAGAQTASWAELGPGRGYGLGFGVDTDLARSGFAGNDGTIFWAGSERLYFWVDRRERIVGLWMTQAYIAQPAPYVDSYLFEIMNRARELTYAAREH